MAYFFYRLFEVDINSWDGKTLITDDVIVAEDREHAKQLIIKRHGDYPFRKTKILVSGEKYYYLTDSNEYWYKFHHEKYHLKCDVCGKEFDIEGSRKLFIFQNKYGTYCSNECKNTITNLVKKNNPWINKDDHIGIPKDNEANLAGYIYRITNKKTLKSYIGKTINAPLFRWWQHLKTSGKFDNCNISDLVFEVLEIVVYDEENPTDALNYTSKEDKLSHREMFYITKNQTANSDYGFNKMIEKSKIEDQIKLKLFEEASGWPEE